jgi:polar amino acid transport system substrate-binding protein
LSGAQHKFIILVALVLVLSSLAHIEAGPVYDRVTKSGVVRLGVPYNLVPQGFLNSQGEWVGFEVELAGQLAKHLNLKLEAVKVNDKTWRSLLARGMIDAAFCCIRHTRSVDREFDLSEAYFYDSPQILGLKGVFRSVNDFKGQRIGVVQGKSSERAAMKLLRNLGDEQAENNVVSYPDAASCFMALSKSKIAGWMDSGLTLLEYASRHQGKFEMIEALDNPQGLAVALPSDDSAWRDLVNFALQDMALDGSLDKVFDRWFGSQTPYPFPRRRSLEIWPE